MSEMDKIKRERVTENKVRKLDANEIVDWIHLLEDEIKELREDRE